MGDTVDEPLAQRFGGNPADHAAGATRSAKALFGRVAYVGAPEAADKIAVVLGVGEEV